MTLIREIIIPVLTRYYHTLIHLKPIQIRYQLWYRIRRYWRKLTALKYPLSTQKEATILEFKPFIKKYSTFKDYQFTFLNKDQLFSKNFIDWDLHKFGKLWTYNLNYFDFLLQPEITPKTGLELILDFISKLNKQSIALEPYPTALRGINWIKFISSKCKNDTESPGNLSAINASLFAQYQILLDNIEYHLLGNHLLEDGFSLLFGAFYFSDKSLYAKSIEILKSELNEQILDDGGHFELSPMYHQIILDRLLDCINLLQNNQRFDDQKTLLILMKEKAGKMLQWLNCITFSNGQIPLFNDSALGIAPSTDQLNEYAFRLALSSPESLREIRLNSCNLSSSGYRRFNINNYECIIDIGRIGSDYQSGHSHADTFNFELHVNNRPVITDTGTSTYEINQTRFYERSTAAHNTVVFNNSNSSQVWSGHRVAKRAKVKIINDLPDLVSASHDGYLYLKQTHTRTFQNLGDTFCIIDELDNKGVSYLHFHPSEEIRMVNNQIIGKDFSIEFNGEESIELFNSKYSPEFNTKLKRTSARISFRNKLEILFK